MKNKKKTTNSKKEVQIKKEINSAIKKANKEGLDKIKVNHYNPVKTIVGEKRLTDPDTGEQYLVDLVQKNVYGDNGFYKIWLADLLGLMDEIAKGKMKIFFYLMDHMKKDNIILAGTTTEIAKNCKASMRTVYETLDYLHDKDIIRTIQRGVYQLNANLLFKGGSNARRAILVQYNKIDTIELTKDKQLEI
ncbi:MAG: RepL [Microviridae sp.]|nr:MAG: RepL [Microviridae sp.]